MESVPSTSRRFIDYISPPQNWVVEIQNSTLNLNYLRSNEVWNRQPKTLKRYHIPEYGAAAYTMKSAELCQPIEENPELILDTVQCVWTKYILVALGQHISAKTAEKICRIIFAAQWLNEGVVGLFYSSFFPVYLQREYSWLCLDLLKRAYAARPKLFMRLFYEDLIKSVRIPRRVLQDFVVNLKTEQRNDFMKALMRANLSSEEFIHHLPTINLLFLDSEKSSPMCVYVALNLEKHAPDCYTNRDFGRLLLSLLKNMAGTDVNQRGMKELIDSHGSEYKGPCLSFLDGMIGELVEAQYRLIEQPRFFIQRPFEGHRAP